MSFPYPIPATPRVISPSPTPSEASERQDTYFAPVTRSAKKQSSPRPESINEEKDDSGSDSSLEKRARTRSRSPNYYISNNVAMNGTAISKRRRMSGLTQIQKSVPLQDGNLPPPQENGHLSPYDRVKKSWREFSRSPSPLGLIPLHRHYRNLIHKHEIPRKALHVSIGFVTLYFYRTGTQAWQISPVLLGLLIPIASTDLIRHRLPSFNTFYVRCLGALMRESEVEGYNGVIWYLLGTYVAMTFFPKDISVMSILLLSWCDTAASTFGRIYGKYTIRLRRGKSLAGSLAAWATGTLTALFFWGYFGPRTPHFEYEVGGFMYHGALGLPEVVRQSIGWTQEQATLTGMTATVVLSVCTGIIASVSEFIDFFSWDDNLTIPLFSSAGMWLFLRVFGQ